MKSFLNFRHRFKKKKNADKSSVSHSDQSFKKVYKRYIPDIAVLLGCAVLLTFFFPRGKSFQFSNLKEGSVYVGAEIIAPFTFPVNKNPEEYENDVKHARESVAPVFQRNDSIEEEQKQKLKTFCQSLV